MKWNTIVGIAGIAGVALFAYIVMLLGRYFIEGAYPDSAPVVLVTSYVVSATLYVTASFTGEDWLWPVEGVVEMFSIIFGVIALYSITFELGWYEVGIVLSVVTAIALTFFSWQEWDRLNDFTPFPVLAALVLSVIHYGPSLADGSYVGMVLAPFTLYFLMEVWVEDEFLDHDRLRPYFAAPAFFACVVAILAHHQSAWLIWAAAFAALLVLVRLWVEEVRSRKSQDSEAAVAA